MVKNYSAVKCAAITANLDGTVGECERVAVQLKTFKKITVLPVYAKSSVKLYFASCVTVPAAETLTGTVANTIITTMANARSLFIFISSINKINVNYAYTT